MNNRTQEIALELIQMSRDDFLLQENLAKTGELFKGYHPRMEELHLKNADRLEEIVLEMGWPSVTKVGSEASYAAWLILQHAISKPSLQRTCYPLLEEMANNNEIVPYEVAALYDRICFFENRPQKYGTQFDFDESGELSPWPIEEPDKVDLYRKEVGLPPLSEMITRMREVAKRMNEKPSAPYDVRLKERLEWSKKVGWIE